MKTSIIVTKPAAEPVSVQEAKDQLRIDANDLTFDAEVTRIITEARVWLEENYNLSIITQTREQRQDNLYDRWPLYRIDSQRLYNRFAITLLKPPLQSMVSFTYMDTSGNTQTLAEGTDFIAAGKMTPIVGQQEIIIPRIYPANQWPSFKWVPEAIKIQYQSGFGPDSTYVPQAIKRALLMLITTFYENRLEEVDSRATKLDFSVDKIMSAFIVYDNVNINL